MRRKGAEIEIVANKKKKDRASPSKDGDGFSRQKTKSFYILTAKTKKNLRD